MKATLVLSLGLLAHSATAIVLNERDVPAVVSFDLERRKVEDPVRREQARRKRDQTVSVDIVNPQDLSIYWINGTVGNPAQSVTLAIDTGSSDTWVNVANSKYCSQDSEPCKPFGTYDHTKSSTYNLVDHNLNNTYADGSQSLGDFVTDTVEFGGVTLKNFQFGVAYQTSSDKGILGVGYVAGEGERQNKYNNFPLALVDAGYINSPAFSLYLNDLHASKGQILFGGVDTSKYIGELQSVPMIATDGIYYSLAIALTGLSLTKGSGKASSYSSSQFPLLTTLDCGSTFVVLPEAISKGIYNDLDVTYNSTSNYGYLPCSTKNEAWNLTYAFSGIDISIPISELVLDVIGYEGDEELCLFGITIGDENTVLMGDPFLRSAYVVYDLGNNEISLAQANFKPGTEHILEIGNGTNAVPGATLVPSGVTSVINSQAFQTTKVETVTNVPTATSVPSSGSDSSSSSSSGSHATGAASTSKSKGMAAALPTSEAKHLVAGLAGAAGLLLAL